MVCARPARTGFTLVELMAALLLMSVLMVGVLAVIGALAEMPRAGARAGGEAAGEEEAGGTRTAQGAQPAWLTLLAGDLAHADRMLVARRDRLTFIGMGALDTRDRRRRHRRVRVTYFLEEAAGRSWLIREQVAEDVLVSRNLQRDLVAVGVSGFEIAPRGGGAGAVREVTEGSAGPARPGTGSPAGPAASRAAAAGGREAAADLAGGADGGAPREVGRAQAPGDAGTERRVFLYNGLRFYEEYLPAEARRDIGAGGGGEGGGEGGGGVGDAGGEETVGDGAGDGAADLLPGAPAAPKRYRVRAWRGGASEPFLDRRIVVGGGG